MTEVKDWYASARDRTNPRPPRWQPPDWFAVAFRFCRHGADGLARHFRVVPDSHRILGGVRCVCGAETLVPEREFAPCIGGCGRWFISDGETVRAAKLPT